MLYGKTAAAMPSRFIKELPEGEIERKGGYSTPSRYGSYGSTGYSNRRYEDGGFGGYQSAPTRTSFTSAPTVTAKSAPIIELSKGDMVHHTAFGRGLVLSVMKMGGDALLEIAFDQIGTKKLMAKTASQHMKKL
jgi:DNA helicase-2/ATP-dependent DNA helicase PcrA